VARHPLVPKGVAHPQWVPGVAETTPNGFIEKSQNRAKELCGYNQTRAFNSEFTITAIQSGMTSSQDLSQITIKMQCFLSKKVGSLVCLHADMRALPKGEGKKLHLDILNDQRWSMVSYGRDAALNFLSNPAVCSNVKQL
jgi:hypothetical protein